MCADISQGSHKTALDQLNYLTHQLAGEIY